MRKLIVVILVMLVISPCFAGKIGRQKEIRPVKAEYRACIKYSNGEIYEIHGIDTEQRILDMVCQKNAYLKVSPDAKLGPKWKF